MTDTKELLELKVAIAELVSSVRLYVRGHCGGYVVCTWCKPLMEAADSAEKKLNTASAVI
jgi:hypothetical protein